MAPDDISAPSAGDAAASTTDLPSTAAVPAPTPPAAAVTTSAPPPSAHLQPHPSPHAPIIATESTNGALPPPATADSPAAASATTTLADSSTRVTVSSTAAEASTNPHIGAPQAPPPTVSSAPEPIDTAVADIPSAAETAQSQHLNGDVGSSASPAMSHGHHGSGMARPVQGGYGNAASSYGSPSPHTGGYLYSNATQPPADAYRASPGAQVSLPSVKSFDPISQQTQQPPPPGPPSHHSPQHMSPHPPPPPMSLPGSIAHAPAMPNMLPHNYMMPPNPYLFPSDQGGPPRFPIPPHAVRGPKKVRAPCSAPCCRKGCWCPNTPTPER